MVKYESIRQKMKLIRKGNFYDRFLYENIDKMS